jgi:hypothetical protein
MDWLQFARAFRITDSKVPFLFVAGTADLGLVADVAPNAEVLPKPFSLEAFLDAVARLAPDISPGPARAVSRG